MILDLPAQGTVETLGSAVIWKMPLKQLRLPGFSGSPHFKLYDTTFQLLADFKQKTRAVSENVRLYIQCRDRDASLSCVIRLSVLDPKTSSPIGTGCVDKEFTPCPRGSYQDWGHENVCTSKSAIEHVDDDGNVWLRVDLAVFAESESTPTTGDAPMHTTTDAAKFIQSCMLRAPDAPAATPLDGGEWRYVVDVNDARNGTLSPAFAINGRYYRVSAAATRERSYQASLESGLVSLDTLDDVPAAAAADEDESGLPISVCITAEPLARAGRTGGTWRHQRLTPARRNVLEAVPMRLDASIVVTVRVVEWSGIVAEGRQPPAGAEKDMSLATATAAGGGDLSGASGALARFAAGVADATKPSPTLRPSALMEEYSRRRGVTRTSKPNAPTESFVWCVPLPPLLDPATSHTTVSADFTDCGGYTWRLSAAIRMSGRLRLAAAEPGVGDSAKDRMYVYGALKLVSRPPNASAAGGANGEVAVHFDMSLLSQYEARSSERVTVNKEFRKGDSEEWCQLRAVDHIFADAAALVAQRPVGDDSDAVEYEPFTVLQLNLQNHTATAPPDLMGGGSLYELAKVVPVRLTGDERELLECLISAVKVCEYADKVDDVRSRVPRPDRVIDQVEDFATVVSGLTLAADFRKGKQLLHETDGDTTISESQRLIAHLVRLVEVGRRFKSMNPDRLRVEYGPLLLMLQDSGLAEVRQRLGYYLADAPVQTAAHLLGGAAAAFFETDDARVAATPIFAGGRTPDEMARMRDAKAAALARVRAAHGDAGERAVRSLDDALCLRHETTECLDRMIGLLHRFFPRRGPKKATQDLAIRVHENGSMLSHTHDLHYQYVLESLTLWRNIMREMFSLWRRTEDDILDVQVAPYRFMDTGQGFHRVQPAPRVGQAMYRILATTRRELGMWVGSSVVHLGDVDVPNALVFIDKYTQVPRIIRPLLITIDGIDDLCARPGIGDFIRQRFGGPDDAKVLILRDFFKHAFDGSGDDGGACIDGRLTSAWNWCSKLAEKEYYPIFQLTGFQSFDGEFR